MENFLNAIKTRRSIYAIGGGSPVDDAALRRLVQEAVQYTPSAFHMQSSRAVLLLGDEHHALWKIAEDCLREVVPAEQFAQTAQKLAGFAAGHGTVLFFDDDSVTRSFAAQYAQYSDHFPVWAQQANGMLQFAVWTLLELAGLGATLQHYNPLIDERVRARWELPESWRMIAQMPFGTPEAAPGPKSFEPIQNRVKVFGCGPSAHESGR